MPRFKVSRNGEFFRSWLLRWYPVVDRPVRVCTCVCVFAKHAYRNYEADALRPNVFEGC